MLLLPQPLGPETQPYQALLDVGFQSNQLVSQIGQPPLLLMNLIPSAPLSGIRNLPLGPSNPPPQTIMLQPLRLPHRRHLAVQRHPHRIEQPRRYSVPLQVSALQRRSWATGRNFGRQFPPHPAIQLTVCCQDSITSRTVQARVTGNARLVCARLPHQPSCAAASARSARRRAERCP